VSMSLLVILAVSAFAPLEVAAQRGDFPKLGSVLVARHGQVVYEHYFDGDAQTPRDTRSATKTITGMLVGIAVQEKKLDKDTHVWPLLGEQDKAGITVEQLLTMSSALDCNDWQDESPGNEEKMYPLQDWVRFVLDLPVREARGFSYCTGGALLLGEALHKATGVPVDRYAKEKLFAPLGIANVEWARSPLGVPMTGGGLKLTTRALWKLAQLYLDGARQIVSADWVRESLTPRARIDPQTQYGYLWWLKSFGGQPAYFMTGNGGNKVVVLPGLDAVVVITSTNFRARGMHEATEKLLVEYILPILTTG
jgi:CubicO group peptidase (beta-lactamase class C family)